MYHVSAQGVDERMISVHYYYYLSIAVSVCICHSLGVSASHGLTPLSVFTDPHPVFSNIIPFPCVL